LRFNEWAIPAIETGEKPISEMLEMDKYIAKEQGYCHVVQSAESSAAKESNHWKIKTLEVEAGKHAYPMFVYSRKVPTLGRLNYAPKLTRLLQQDIAEFTMEIAKKSREAFAFKLEFDQLYSEDFHDKLLKSGWKPTHRTQYDHTVLVGLDEKEDEIFASLKKRARWETRTAEKNGVKVEKVDCTEENLNKMYDLLKITTQRGNFRIKDRAYHLKYWQLFERQGLGSLYFAAHEGDLLCGAFIIQIGERAFYKDGASIREKSNLYASRYMHWQIIKDLKKNRCKVYDLCGVPGAGDNLSSGLYTFKTGFGEPVRLQGSYILPLSGLAFKLWAKYEPLFLKFYIKSTNKLWY
jgi:serine/alanine adding enzyme